MMRHDQKLLPIGSLLVASLLGSESLAEPIIQELQTDNGWKYQYIHVDDAKGYKINIAIPTNFVFEWENPWAVNYAGTVIAVSGYGDVSRAEKAAIFEDLRSNGNIYFRDNAFWADIFIDEREIEEASALFAATFSDSHYDQSIIDDIIAQDQPRMQFYRETPSGKLSQMVSKLLYDDVEIQMVEHKFNIDELTELKSNDINNLMDELFNYGGVKISVAGNEEPEKIHEFIDESLSNFSPESQAVTLSNIEINTKGETNVLTDDATEKAIISIAANSFTPQNLKERAAYSILKHVMTGSQSRLQKFIREELRASYGFHFYTPALDNDDTLLITAGQTNPEDQGDVVNAVIEIYDDIRENGVTEEEFEIAKQANITRWNEAILNENSIAFLMTTTQLRADNEPNYLENLARYKEITYEEINPIIKKLIPNRDALMTSVVSSSAEGLDAHCVIEDLIELDECD